MSSVAAGPQLPSQSIMFPILWLLLGFTLPALGFHIPVSCPQAEKCQRALLSDSSDVLLSCSVSKAHWSYSGLSKDGHLVNLSSVSNVEMRPEGELAIRNPSPYNTGLYLCQAKNGTQVAQYEIDFQDANKLHVTHKGLGQSPLPNSTLNLGNMELVYTQWEPWQRCNRCGKPGERKRLGFCYIKEPLKDPIPCGLYLGKLRMWLVRARPEVQVEACHVQCEDSYWFTGDYVVFDNFRLMEESESAWLSCPLASIYRPVQWEANNTPLTWEGQLSSRDLSTFMDLLKGGQQLQIFQPATYRCFVDQELVAQFNPTKKRPETQRWQPGKIRAPLGKADSVLEGLKLMLLMGSALVVIGLLCKVFHPSQSKKRSQILLAK
uniref:Family with sequence similarity 187, member B n=1 Tax=Nannospalax galili TaxID=1026970 RepID=A0A8C6QNH6_NANGA